MTTRADPLQPIEQPRLLYRNEHYYASILTQATWAEISSVLPSLWREVRESLRTQDAVPAGKPFVRIVITDAGPWHEVEAAIPVAAPIRRHGRVRAGVMPAGNYVARAHSGALRTLDDAHRTLVNWVREQGGNCPCQPVDEGVFWSARAVSFGAGGNGEPDPESGYAELASLVVNLPETGGAGNLACPLSRISVAGEW